MSPASLHIPLLVLGALVLNILVSTAPIIPALDITARTQFVGTQVFDNSQGLTEIRVRLRLAKLLWSLVDILPPPYAVWYLVRRLAIDVRILNQQNAHRAPCKYDAQGRSCLRNSTFRNFSKTIYGFVTHLLSLWRPWVPFRCNWRGQFHSRNKCIINLCIGSSPHR